MTNQTSWQRKVFDEPRVGFVAEYGSQLHRPVKRPEPPPAPAPSPLDKIIDEDRLGFIERHRADSAHLIANSAARTAAASKRGRR